MDAAAIIERIEGIVAGEGDSDARLQAVCDLLKAEVDHYDWVGLYIVDAPGELALGPYAGDATEHDRISFGEGICGQAAEREATFVVPDVSKEENYLSCSIRVKSEIVVPIMRDGAVVEEIAADSRMLDDIAQPAEGIDIGKIFVNKQNRAKFR